MAISFIITGCLFCQRICCAQAAAVEGAARQVLPGERGCLQEGLIARSYPICPSLLPSFSPTSFLGFTLLSFPLHFKEPYFILPKLITGLYTMMPHLYSPGLERAGLGLQPSAPQAEVAEAIGYRWWSLSGSCPPSAAGTPQHQHSLKSPLSPQGGFPGDPHHHWRHCLGVSPCLGLPYLTGLY